MYLYRDRELTLCILLCIYDTGVEISGGTPMLDRVVHELISDEDESSAPRRIDMIRIEYIPDEVTDRLRLTMISAEVYLTVYSIRTSYECLELCYGSWSIEMRDIDRTHDEEIDKRR
jgi:hypothetical protein